MWISMPFGRAGAGRLGLHRPVGRRAGRTNGRTTSGCRPGAERPGSWRARRRVLRRRLAGAAAELVDGFVLVLGHPASELGLDREVSGPWCRAGHHRDIGADHGPSASVPPWSPGSPPAIRQAQLQSEDAVSAGQGSSDGLLVEPGTTEVSRSSRAGKRLKAPAVAAFDGPVGKLANAVMQAQRRREDRVHRGRGDERRSRPPSRSPSWQIGRRDRC
jgi:hypothetical protein